MIIEMRSKRSLSAWPLLLAGTLFLGTVQAQEVADDEVLEEVVVTGSRIARDEYSSAAPLQTFDIQSARQVGVTSISELLQRSTIANGQQLNGELNTNAGNSNASEAPAIGGVGSANISLRGLGPERTLVLVNGRRLGSSGVRGAPAQPDINLLPMNMVERIEIITEGASSVYGADAVAGVVNVILRDQFDGLEVSLNGEIPADDGGEITQFSFITGASNDRANFVVSGEYFDRTRVTAGSRYDCPRDTEIDASGNVTSLCFNGFFDNSVFELSGLGSGDSPFIWYTPGSSDTGIPNWSGATAAAPDPALPGGSERADDRDRVFFLPEYSDWDERLASDLVMPMERFSVVALGSYQPEGLGGDDEFYFESYYMNRQLTNNATHEQIFPTVPAMIPQEDANGNIVVEPVDLFWAADQNDPNQFLDDGVTPNPNFGMCDATASPTPVAGSAFPCAGVLMTAAGEPILVDNPLSPFASTAIPIVTLEDIPQRRNVELEHFRFVGGLRGDLTGSQWFSDHEIAYDLSVSYDRGIGFESRKILNESNLSLSIDTLRLNAAGEPICGVNSADLFGFVTPANCVPVRMFAPSIYTGGVTGEGTFSSDAEREFLLGTRTNRTVVEQTLFSGFLTGNLVELPAGPLGFALGLEHRIDSIDSAADFLGVNGGVAAENPLTEGESRGRRNLFDAYAEVNIPVFETFGFEAAGRYTKESNFGSETTYRVRATFRPTDWVSASASFGTSFRAPNLREQFLADQFSGVGGDSDPCAIPDAANVGGVYDPTMDTRSQTVIDNCIQDGADPTILGLTASTTIPVTVGGNPQDLVAETSESLTATLQFTPQISDNFDLDIAISYFDIEIEDTVRSISATTIMTRCFEDAPGLASPFCSRLERSGAAADPQFNFITTVDASFVNIGLETAQGIDLNTRLGFGLGRWDVTWSNAVTFQTERDEQIFANDPIEDLVDDFGVPDTRWNSVVSAALNNWEFVWTLRYLSETHTSRVASIDAECDSFDDATNRTGTTPTASLCVAEEGWFNDIAATYAGDTWSVSAGVNNVLDEDPPIVDMSAGSNRLGRLTSSGYDQFGQTFFLNVTMGF
jgi:iron complex outermembrane receptor protein